MFGGLDAHRTKPHKFALTMALAKLYEEDPSRENRFHIDSQLEQNFRTAIYQLDPMILFAPSMIEAPFYFLQTNGFWHLHVAEGKEPLVQDIMENKHGRFTKKRLLDMYGHESLSGSFDKLFRNEELCNKLI
jgi:predicted restriction endonuclease